MARIIEVTIGKANPDNMNGVSRSVHCLADNLYGDGVSIEVWGLTPTPKEPTPPRRYPLKLFKFRRARLLLDPALKREANGLAPGDVIHFHGCLIPEFRALAKIAQARGARWVVSPRGGLMARALSRNARAKRLYMKLFESWFLNHAAMIQGLVPREAEEVRPLIDHRRTIVIPNGVNFSDIGSQLPPVRTRADRAAPIAGFVGRLDTEQKGLDLMLRGFAAAKARGVETRLELVGDGKDRLALEALARELDIEDRVTFHGELRGAAKFAQLATFDYFIHTSRWEGMPNAVLEALAVGLPVLTSEQTNMGDAIRTWECGLELAANEPEAIADGLERFEQLHREGRLREMGANAERMIVTDFDWRNVARRIHDEIYVPVAA